MEKLKYGLQNIMVLWRYYLFTFFLPVFVNIVVAFSYFSIFKNILHLQMLLRLPRCACWPVDLKRKEKLAFVSDQQENGDIIPP